MFIYTIIAYVLIVIATYVLSSLGSIDDFLSDLFQILGLALFSLSLPALQPIGGTFELFTNGSESNNGSGSVESTDLVVQNRYSMHLASLSYSINF